LFGSVNLARRIDILTATKLLFESRRIKRVYDDMSGDGQRGRGRGGSRDDGGGRYGGHDDRPRGYGVQGSGGGGKNQKQDQAGRSLRRPNVL
jgi:hypothetical protein